MALRLELPFYAGIALATGPFLFAKGFRLLRVQRLIRNTPTARIRSMAMGLVEVTGAVMPRSTTAAPFSGRSCAYWEVDIATRSRRNVWSIVHRNTSGHPFYLRDETGLALVYPKGADCKLEAGTNEECYGLNLPPCYAEYLQEHSSGLMHMWRLGVLRFRERILEEGRAVYVLGSAMPRPRVVTVSEGEALAATGTDGAPSVSRVRSLDGEVAGVIRRGENEKTFIISEQSELSLSAGLGWQAAAMIAGGPLLTVFGLLYWLHALATRHLPW